MTGSVAFVTTLKIGRFILWRFFTPESCLFFRSASSLSPDLRRASLSWGVARLRWVSIRAWSFGPVTPMDQYSLSRSQIKVNIGW